MNTTLTDDLMQQLRADGLPGIAQQLGVPPQQAEQAVSAALPLLLGAMGRNARAPGGADALFGALSRDHQGLDPGNVLGTALAGGGLGEGILRHVLGRRAPVATQGLGGIGGLGQDRAGMLLRILAPVVMAYLARRMFNPAAGRDTPSATSQGLGQLLEREEQEVRAQQGHGAGLLSMLDRDGDGDVDLQDFMGAARGVQTAEQRSPRPLI